MDNSTFLNDFQRKHYEATIADRALRTPTPGWGELLRRQSRRLEKLTKEERIQEIKARIQKAMEEKAEEYEKSPQNYEMFW